MLTEYDKAMIRNAQEFASIEELKAHGYVTYLICKRKGLLRKAFPSTIPKQTEKQKAKVEASKKRLDADASLRDALDDLIVRYRGIPVKDGKVRKITVSSAIKEIEDILHKH